MLISKDWLAHLSLATTALGFVALAVQEPGASGAPTAAQAAAGAAAIRLAVRRVIKTDLRGQSTATPRAGTEFLAAWGSRSASDLLSFVQLTMPPGNPGTLSADMRKHCSSTTASSISIILAISSRRSTAGGAM